MADLACKVALVDLTAAISVASDSRTPRYLPVVMSIVPVGPIRVVVVAEEEERTWLVKTPSLQVPRVNRVIGCRTHSHTTISNSSSQFNSSSSSNPNNHLNSNHRHNRTTSHNQEVVKTPPCWDMVEKLITRIHLSCHIISIINRSSSSIIAITRSLTTTISNKATIRVTCGRETNQQGEAM